MNNAFHWTEKSLSRNLLTSKFEPIQPYILLEFCEKLGVTHFFDIGANIGFYSLFISLSQSVDKIYSFEAANDTFNALQINVELNKLTEKVVCVNKAVSSKMGLVNFQTQSPLSGINCVVDTSFHENSLFGSAELIDACAIDDFSILKNQKIALKIDVEGHEGHVLEGCLELLRNNKCILQIEIYSAKNNEIHHRLADLGYKKLFQIKNDFYYANFSEIDSQMVIDVFEHATALFINAGQGKWPELVKKDAVFVNSSVGSDGLLKAFISYDPMVFNREVEYAFYINVDGKRIFSKWYSDSPSIEYKINNDIFQKSVSVSGFVREKNLQDKKIMRIVTVV